jgi:flagellar motor protein MotB
LYHVTVVQRTVKAVNYQYRTEPTEIDFAGTVLLPQAKGHAWVESKRGRTEIDGSLERMAPSQQYGREYLTYVLWAISPEGRPHNLGELILSGSGKSHLRVTTDLQAFAMIVTAEPYSAVRTPSDVVVMENEIRPDTAGRIVAVNASYDLLPRGQYTWQVSDKLNKEITNAPRVSPSEYEALIELYQAENAIGIAKESGAGQYAPNTFSKAQQLLASAQDWNRRKSGDRHVVEFAKEATQTAEDSRIIAQQRQQDERVTAASSAAAALEAKAQSAVAAAVADKQRAEAEAQQARYDADSALQRAEAERRARERAEADAARARASAPLNDAAAVAPISQQTAAPPVSTESTRDLRIRVYEALNKGLAVRDTPRGIIVTIPASAFTGEQFISVEQAVRVAGILSRFRGLQVSCEGYTSEDNSDALSMQRASAVMVALIANGLPASSVTAAGFGNARPLGPNNSAEGRAANSRVEIVISGDSIGTLPYWERTYVLGSRR